MRKIKALLRRLFRRGPLVDPRFRYTPDMIRAINANMSLTAFSEARPLPFAKAEDNAEITFDVQ